VRVAAGDEPGVPVRQEVRGEVHQQAQDAALRALLRAALPGRGVVQRAAPGVQGPRRERRRRQACYAPLVEISARHGFDVVFAAHPRLCIWYVPTRLRQLCHQARGGLAAAHVLGCCFAVGCSEME
jgi:hypothetical protein